MIRSLSLVSVIFVLTLAVAIHCAGDNEWGPEDGTYDQLPRGSEQSSTDNPNDPGYDPDGNHSSDAGSGLTDGSQLGDGTPGYDPYGDSPPADDPPADDPPGDDPPGDDPPGDDPPADDPPPEPECVPTEIDCVCVPGSRRYCDDPMYCNWGVQYCNDDGLSWGTCTETSMPDECEGWFGGLFTDEEYDEDAEECCIESGFCCQDYHDLDDDGDWSESLGSCEDVIDACGVEICDNGVDDDGDCQVDCDDSYCRC